MKSAAIRKRDATGRLTPEYRYQQERTQRLQSQDSRLKKALSSEKQRLKDLT